MGEGDRERRRSGKGKESGWLAVALLHSLASSLNGGTQALATLVIDENATVVLSGQKRVDLPNMLRRAFS